MIILIMENVSKLNHQMRESTEFSLKSIALILTKNFSDSITMCSQRKKPGWCVCVSVHVCMC